jgi:hypothetical protein
MKGEFKKMKRRKEKGERRNPNKIKHKKKKILILSIKKITLNKVHLEINQFFFLFFSFKIIITLFL